MEVFCNNKIPLFFVVLLATLTTLAQGQGTQNGFYQTSCPRVEAIVQAAVAAADRANAGVPPGLVRMFFHDCFVNGCDACILLNGRSTERTAPPNSLLRGFEIIDAAKTELERVCPGVVSCADILALDARDSVLLLGELRTGKGLNAQDLVTLSGAHTIGTAACALFSYMLYNFNNTNGPDTFIDQAFLPTLRNLCPNGGDGSRRVALDTGSQNRFDKSYYANLRNGRGVIEFDQVL
ncbi:hypothetical protein Lser_V15G12681 [Lactuca serriola]